MGNNEIEAAPSGAKSSLATLCLACRRHQVGRALTSGDTCSPSPWLFRIRVPVKLRQRRHAQHTDHNPTHWFE